MGCGEDDHRARATAARLELCAHRGELVSRLAGEHRWPPRAGPARRPRAPDDPRGPPPPPARAELLLALVRARGGKRARHAAPGDSPVHRPPRPGTETP